MNTPEPCASCKHLYYDAMSKNMVDEYIDCKKSLPILFGTSAACTGYARWDTAEPVYPRKDRSMPNWTREKPTVSGWYWYKLRKDDKAKMIYWDSCSFTTEKYWWAKAEPPEWDSEVTP